jgi:hypothetical protein
VYIAIWMVDTNPAAALDAVRLKVASDLVAGLTGAGVGIGPSVIHESQAVLKVKYVCRISSSSYRVVNYEDVAFSARLPWRHIPNLAVITLPAPA